MGRFGTKHGGRNLNDEVALAAQVMCRTPCATDGTNGGPNARDSKGGLHLTAQVMWPTPTVACATGGQTSRSGDRKGELLLSGLVKMFPTPCAKETGGTPKGKMQRMLSNCEEVRGRTPEDWSGGSLNPNWVEWLMGWPPFWTAMAPLPLVAWSAWLEEFRLESTDSGV